MEGGLCMPSRIWLCVPAYDWWCSGLSRRQVKRVSGVWKLEEFAWQSNVDSGGDDFPAIVTMDTLEKAFMMRLNEIQKVLKKLWAPRF